jgi:hypothetical protein
MNKKSPKNNLLYFIIPTIFVIIIIIILYFMFRKGKTDKTDKTTTKQPVKDTSKVNPAIYISDETTKNILKPTTTISPKQFILNNSSLNFTGKEQLPLNSKDNRLRLGFIKNITINCSSNIKTYYEFFIAEEEQNPITQEIETKGYPKLADGTTQFFIETDDINVNKTFNFTFSENELEIKESTRYSYSIFYIKNYDEATLSDINVVIEYY